MKSKNLLVILTCFLFAAPVFSCDLPPELRRPKACAVSTNYLTNKSSVEVCLDGDGEVCGHSKVFSPGEMQIYCSDTSAYNACDKNLLEKDEPEEEE